MLFATQNPPGQYGGRKVWVFFVFFSLIRLHLHALPDFVQICILGLNLTFSVCLCMPTILDFLIFILKGERNAKTNLFLFESIGIVD